MGVPENVGGSIIDLIFSNMSSALTSLYLRVCSCAIILSNSLFIKSRFNPELLYFTGFGVVDL